VGLIVTIERDQGRQGISLAALAVSVNQAIQRAIEAGAEPDEIEPKVHITMSGKIKSLEVTIP
jgi:hypothetical protein